MKTEINGIETTYLEEGTGPALVIFHGWGASKESVMPIVNILKGKYRVLAPDMPGCGETAEPLRPYDADDYAAWAKAFLEATGAQNPVLIGHSNGGRTIIRLLASTDVQAEKVVLIDSAGLAAKHSPAYYIKVYAYKLAKHTLRLLHMYKTLERLQKSAGSEDYKNASPVMRQTMSNLLRRDLTADLKKITAPTLLVWGEKDTATPLADGKKMEHLIAGSGLVVLSGAGHFSYIDCYGQFARVMESFLL